MNIEVGKVYILKGGHVMRYQGLWFGQDDKGRRLGPCHVFRSVTAAFDPDCPSGHFADVSEVVREPDRQWLENRRDQARARGLEAEALNAEAALYLLAQ